MPKPRTKASREPEWVVSPWRRSVRRNRDSTEQRSSYVENAVPVEIESLAPLDARKRQKLKCGIERLIQEMSFEEMALESGGDEDAWKCVLAFEMSGGHFVALATARDENCIRYCLTGTRQSASFPDCKYNDAQELYEVEFVDAIGKQPKTTIHVCNTGGDFAKLEMDSIPEPGTTRLTFRCMELYANDSDDSRIRPYFLEVEDSEEVVVNVGMLCVRGER